MKKRKGEKKLPYILRECSLVEIQKVPDASRGTALTHYVNGLQACQSTGALAHKQNRLINLKPALSYQHLVEIHYNPWSFIVPLVWKHTFKTWWITRSDRLNVKFSVCYWKEKVILVSLMFCPLPLSVASTQSLFWTCAVHPFQLNYTCLHACVTFTLWEKSVLKTEIGVIKSIFHHYGRTGKGQKEKQAEEKRQPPKQR